MHTQLKGSSGKSDDAGVAQVRNLRRVVTQFPEDVIGVLTVLGGAEARLCRLTRKLDRYADVLVTALVGYEHLAHARLGMVEA